MANADPAVLNVYASNVIMPLRFFDLQHYLLSFGTIAITNMLAALVYVMVSIRHNKSMYKITMNTNVLCE
jgi:hypothetical protein